MVLITRCCCWRNVRSGSFAAGFYTLILHTIILTGGAFNLNTVMDTIPMLILSLLMLACSGCCVITSVLLLIGLCVDSRMLLVPWIISVFTTTLLDILVSLYLLVEADFNKFLAVLFSFDIFICALNIYCLVCVFSQYQEYTEGRGYPVVGRNPQAPPVEYRSERSFLSGGIRTTTDSNATHSSCISVVQSSAPPNEISVVSEDLPCRYQESEGTERKDPSSDAGNLLSVLTSSTEKIIQTQDKSLVSNKNETAENSESVFSEVIPDFDTEDDERALKD